MIRIFSNTYNNSLKFSVYDNLYPFLNKVFSSLGEDFTENWGKENIYIENEMLTEFVEALHNKITLLIFQYAAAQDPTHVLIFDSHNLKLNVRKDFDRLLAHLLLIFDMGKHCIRKHETMKIEIVDD